MKLISFPPTPYSLLPIPSSLPTATFTIPSSKKTAIFTPSICKTCKISRAKRVIYNPTLQLQSCKVPYKQLQQPNYQNNPPFHTPYTTKTAHLHNINIINILTNFANFASPYLFTKSVPQPNKIPL